MSDTNSTLDTRIYWISTGLLALGMVGAGVQELRHAPDLVEAAAALGYPEYLLTILGIAKLLGAPVLIAPQFRVLKEWAYAGFTFDFSGALISHVTVGDPLEVVAPSAVCLVILSISYFFYRRWDASRSGS
jgi:hypothetical protein